MLPLARTALRRIGNDTDVVTFISHYTRGRFASAFGPRRRARAPVARRRHRPVRARLRWPARRLRARYGLGDRPVIVCVSRLVPRKGQDMLIRALPAIRQRIDGAALVIVGGGPYRDDAATAWRTSSGSPSTSCSPTACPPTSCPPTTRWPTCSRCRAGPADRGSTSRVSASSTWRRRRRACPSWPGDSGGAPESVRDGETGLVVDGWDVGAIAAAVGDLLADPDRAAAMGAAGRRWVVDELAVAHQGAAALGELLAG